MLRDGSHDIKTLHGIQATRYIVQFVSKFGSQVFNHTNLVAQPGFEHQTYLLQALPGPFGHGPWHQQVNLRLEPPIKCQWSKLNLLHLLSRLTELLKIVQILPITLNMLVCAVCPTLNLGVDCIVSKTDPDQKF